MADDQNTIDTNSVDLATSLTVAWLSNGHTRASADEVTAFLQTIHQTVAGLSSGSQAEATSETPSTDYMPAVSVRKSLASKDHIISMIDGKPYKTLRRHLATNGLTPDEYRERYGLKRDYPMVSENYSESRRAMAHKIGLGRKPGESPKKKADAAAPAKPRGRAKSVSEAKAAAQSHLTGADAE